MAKLSVKQFTSREAAEAYYLSEVDNAAENERGKYITPGKGQAMTYEAKYREALEGDGPMLQAEAKALGVTLAEVAASVIAARNEWVSAVARIEAARRKAKSDIRAAETAADMHRIAKNWGPS